MALTRIYGNLISSASLTGNIFQAQTITGASIAANTIASSNLTTTGVTSGRYGGSGNTVNITVDAQGRITSAANVASVATAPAGLTTQVQYNNAGAFGGISGVTTDGTRMTASTTIGVGGATPSTSGSGITFPATQSASSNANTLDDYEEGTYTLSLGGTSTTSINAGIYTKVGRMVHCMGLISVTTLGTGSATTITGGLPFNPSNAGGGNSGGSVSYYSGLAVNVIAISPYLIQGDTSLAFGGSAAASTGSSGLAIFGNGARIDYTAVYST